METVVKPPVSEEAESSTVGCLLAHPGEVGPVVGHLLEPRHFALAGYRVIYREIVESYYEDRPIDPLVVAEATGKTLERIWSCEEKDAVRTVVDLASGRPPDKAETYANLVKRDSDYRALLNLSDEIKRLVGNEEDQPEEVAGIASQRAMQIATDSLLTHDIVDYQSLGRNFVQSQRTLMAARAQGVELGAYFGLSFLDSFTRGFKPTELFILAGEPGAGKSAVGWTAGQRFAERQMRKPQDKRIGTLILSLEMGEEPSSGRVAQLVTGLDGGKLREGRTDEDELQRVILEWGKRKDIPLYFNFASAMKASQMRALIVESIRRHNVGLVIIDHMRYFDMDGRFQSKNEEDEEKAKFLKQRLAKDLNIAVMCLAHTTKGIDNTEDRRPKLTHLRGSGQIAAEADFVAMVYRPYNHAKRDDIEEGRVNRTDAEMIYVKNRHGLDGTAQFKFDPSTMTIQ